MGISVVLR